MKALQDFISISPKSATKKDYYNFNHTCISNGLEPLVEYAKLALEKRQKAKSE